MRPTHSALEKGSAMVVTLFMMLVLTGLGTVAFTVATSNQQDSGRDRLAGGALGVAEAGVAHALAYMRSQGVSLLTCDAPSTGSLLCNNDWGYNYLTPASGGHLVTLGTAKTYKVWIQRLQAYAPSTGATFGRYKIFSVGKQGSLASRTITTEVTVKPFPYPIGIYGEQFVRNGGTVSVLSESIFSKGCISKRDHVTFSGATDLAHPQLAPGAHSVQYISEANLSNPDACGVSPTPNKNIHKAPLPGVCNPLYPNDQDAQGGNTVATPCSAIGTSFFNEASLKSYGYVEPRGLPDSQYALLKKTAQAQGNYHDCVASPTVGVCSSGNPTGIVLNGNVLPNAVLYVRLAPGRTLSIQAGSPSNSISNYGEAFCGTRSLLIVVEGGNMHVSAALDAVTAIFVPDGEFQANGTATITGTLFAKSVKLAGTANFKLNPCYFTNFPGGAMNVSPSDFEEVDR